MSVIAHQALLAAISSSPPKAVSVVHSDFALISSSGSTYTFSGMNLGEAASDRKIVVGISYEYIGTCQNATSITVAGQSASSVVFSYDGRYDASMLWVVDLPSGTSGDVVLTLPVTGIRAICSVWAMYGADDTPYDTGTSSAQPPSVSIDVEDNGAIIALYGGNVYTGYMDETWTELIENWDEVTDGSITGSGASEEYETGGTNTISAWPGMTNGNNLVAASWSAA